MISIIRRAAERPVGKLSPPYVRLVGGPFGGAQMPLTTNDVWPYRIGGYVSHRSVVVDRRLWVEYVWCPRFGGK